MKLLAFVLFAIFIVAGAPMVSGPTDAVDIASRTPAISLTSLNVHPPPHVVQNPANPEFYY